MAEIKEPTTPGSTPGSTGTTTYSTETNSNNTSSIVGRVREQATAQLASQKDKATDGLGSVAQAVRETTQHLRDNQHDTVARYAEQAADQIDRFSQSLKNKDVGELMNDAQQLARRQPALFVGGAFALGLLGARFLKSSAPEGRGGYGYGSGGYGNTGSDSTGYGGTGYGATSYGSAGAATRMSGSPSSGATSTTSSSGGENAYGNRVPSAARKASVTSSKRNYPPTEGL